MGRDPLCRVHACPLPPLLPLRLRAHALSLSTVPAAFPSAVTSLMRVSRVLLSVALVASLLLGSALADRSADAPNSNVHGKFQNKDGVVQLEDGDQPNRYMRVYFKRLEEFNSKGNKVRGTEGWGNSWQFSAPVETTFQGHPCKVINLTASITPQNSATNANIFSTFYFFKSDVTLTDGNSSNLVPVRLGELKSDSRATLHLQPSYSFRL